DLRLLLRRDAAGLRPTQVAQPALLFVECVLLELVSRHVDVVAVAGHSVGEYSACVAPAALAPVAPTRLVRAPGRAVAAPRPGPTPSRVPAAAARAPATSVALRLRPAGRCAPAAGPGSRRQCGGSPACAAWGGWAGTR